MTSTKENECLVFSDDSSHGCGRFHSLSLLTIRKDDAVNLLNTYSEILNTYSISSEFKWKKLQGSRYRAVAQEMIDLVFLNLDKLRVDTIIWDLNDSRHRNLQRRNDSENLVRMYYHLVSTTLSKRWPIDGSLWQWYPDCQSSVNWDILKDCLCNKKHPCIVDFFGENPEFENVKVSTPVPSDSKTQKLIQITDLFVGIGNYSYGQFERYQQWCRWRTGQQNFLMPIQKDFSNSEKYRFLIMQYLSSRCKKFKMSVSLNGSEGFNTYRPLDPINFWKYKPQTGKDRAPVK